MKKIQILFLIVIITIFLSGCGSLSYYFTQSIPGHMSLMFRMKEIDTYLEQQDIDPKVRAKLETVLQVRDYASDKLLLPENDSYRYYADLERPYVTWNVTAAPEFSLKPKTWCYFIIGCAAYRGYFNEADAEEEAQILINEGWDVHVGGATAYSTLGFFTDPVLNTMIKWRDYDLAGIIFHELSHQILYIKDDTAFNEAFATSVQIIGLISWMIEYQPDNLDSYLESLKRAEEFRQLKTETREKLKTLYGNTQTDDEKREQKQLIFEQMKQQYETLKIKWGRDSYGYWFKKPLNNARMLSDATYWQYVPSFLNLFFDNEQNWQTFYDRCKEIGKQEKESRKATLTKLGEKPISLPQVLNTLRESAAI